MLYPIDLDLSDKSNIPERNESNKILNARDIWKDSKVYDREGASKKAQELCEHGICMVKINDIF